MTAKDGGAGSSGLAVTLPKAARMRVRQLISPDEVGNAHNC